MFYILGLNMNEGVEDDLILFGDFFFFVVVAAYWLVVIVCSCCWCCSFFLFLFQESVVGVVLIFQKMGKKMKNLSEEDEEYKLSFSANAKMTRG